MTLKTTNRPTNASELLRMVALYVAAILAWQGLAAAMALGAGPMHDHRPDMAAAATRLFHAEHQHRQWHDLGVRHHHAAQDLDVVQTPGADETLDTLAFALTAALALMALGPIRRWPARGRAVWRSTPGWAWRTALPRALFKPPRLS